MTSVIQDRDRQLAELAAEVEAGQAVRVHDKKAEVTFEPLWWGFHLYLNRQAVAQFLADIGGIKDDLKKAAKKNKKVAGLIELYIASRQLWVKAIDKGTGIRFTSPWLVPGAFVPTVWDDGQGKPPPPPPDPGDTALWWSIWERGKGWSSDRVIPAHRSTHAPALATDRAGSYYCVHKGGQGDDRLYLTVYHDGKWSLEAKLPDSCTTDNAPAVTWHPTRGVIVLFQKKYEDRVYWTMRPGHGTGGSWSSPARVDDIWVQSGRMAAAVAGDKLVVTYTDPNLHDLKWTQVDLSSGSTLKWRTPQDIGPRIFNGPALAVDGDNNVICACRVNNITAEYYKKPNQDQWTYAKTRDSWIRTSDNPPGFGCVAATTSGTDFALVYRDDTTDSTKKDRLMMATTASGQYITYGLSFDEPTQIPGRYSAAGPAVIYGTTTNDHDQKTNQVMCVHRGRSA
ncbi:hypothetical protein AGRA3207_007340 [Actinomadura graeca]|uniref:Uncharacterized protein n=1 Tax=Actinomadura graeca TaxID=2750812 RepID=A0ABX8R430_9ACTN|nr:hypothetical protein [Actinomadura graeca]QXJ25790.1 hypothetical protein AGRA3207_007340 [Actinomadura graeca]